MRRGMDRGWRIIQWLMAESWEKEKEKSDEEVSEDGKVKQMEIVQMLEK